MNCELTNQFKQIVLADVFGKQIATHYVEGLVDSKDEAEFEQGLHTLCSKWSKMGKCMETFVRWFQDYKSLKMYAEIYKTRCRFW